MTVTVQLPWPPSVNAMWRNPRSGPLAGRTLLSREGREYRQAVADQVMLQHVPRHTLAGRLQLIIIARPPDRRRRDLDNLLKATLDALQHSGVIIDDAHVDDLHIARGACIPLGQLEVSIAEIVAIIS